MIGVGQRTAVIQGQKIDRLEREANTLADVAVRKKNKSYYLPNVANKNIPLNSQQNLLKPKPQQQQQLPHAEYSTECQF